MCHYGQVLVELGGEASSDGLRKRALGAARLDNGEFSVLSIQLN